MVRVVSLLSGVLGLGFVRISIALFVQYGRLKKLGGTVPALKVMAQQVMYLAIASLLMGLVLAILGFATVSSPRGSGSGDVEGHEAEADDARNYSVDAFPDFDDMLLAQQLHNLDGRSALLDSQKRTLRARLNAARPKPAAAPREHV
jgi:hypothetical protein